MNTVISVAYYIDDNNRIFLSSLERLLIPYQVSYVKSLIDELIRVSFVTVLVGH